MYVVMFCNLNISFQGLQIIQFLITYTVEKWRGEASKRIQCIYPVSNHKLDSWKALGTRLQKQTSRMHGSMERFSFQTMICSATSSVPER